MNSSATASDKASNKLWKKITLQFNIYCTFFIVAYFISKATLHVAMSNRLTLAAGITIATFSVFVGLEASNRFVVPILRKIYTPDLKNPDKPVPQQIGMRVNVADYLKLPVGHRTTFVVGAVDSIDYVSIFTDERNRRQFDLARHYAKDIISGRLREMFDKYISEDENRLSQGAANCFCNALLEWSKPSA